MPVLKCPVVPSVDCAKEKEHNFAKKCYNSLEVIPGCFLPGSAHPYFGIHGASHPNWKGNRNLTSLIRTSYKYNDWRMGVFRRDNFTCQSCNKTHTYLEAHHIIPFYKIFSGFLAKFSCYNKDSDISLLLEKAMDYPLFWDLDNGITLCTSCHRKEGRPRVGL